MTLEELLTPKFLLSLDKLFLKLKSNAVSQASGKRKSKIKGNSLDYSDFRAYVQGDDIKKIDWKAYARNEKTNIKLYDEEKQSKISILLDCSKSMDYGENEENKLLYGKLLASALSYIYIKNDDSVDIFSFKENINAVILNTCNKFKFNNLVKALNEEKADKMTAFDSLKLNMVKDKALVFVLSDFYTENGYKALAKKLQKKNCRLVFLHILTKKETDPDLNGNFILNDIESLEKKSAFIGQEQISEYKKILAEHKNNIKNFCQKRGIMYFDLITDINITDKIFYVLNRLDREWFNE